MTKKHNTLTGYDFRVDPPLTPMRAIRLKCIECHGGSYKEARECHIYDCTLFPLRPGTKKRKIGRPLSEGEKKAAGDRFRKCREAKKQSVLSVPVEKRPSVREIPLATPQERQP